MLHTLHIANVALIDEIDIEFTPGLNILSGETGEIHRAAVELLRLNRVDLIKGSR